MGIKLSGEANPTPSVKPLESIAEQVANADVGPPIVSEPSVDSFLIDDNNMIPAPSEPSPPSAEVAQPDEFIFSCHPLERFQIGSRFRFERGQYKTDDPKEAQALRDLLKDKKLDPFTKRTVKEIDVKLAEAFLAKHTSTGRRGVVESADALQARGQEIGTKPIKPEE